MQPLHCPPLVPNLAQSSLSNPLLGLLVSAVATMVLNSRCVEGACGSAPLTPHGMPAPLPPRSSAMLGIAIALAQQGLLPLHVGMAFVLGSNIGTTAAPLFAAFPAWSEGKVAPLRFSLAYTLMKTAISLALLPLLGMLTPLVASFVSLPGEAVPVGGVVATAHTLYNIVLALVFFPLLGLVAQAVTSAVPTTVKAD